MQQKKKNKIRYFNILITGDNNYNNLKKFNSVMSQIESNIEYVKCIGTFGEKYGAQILAQLFSQEANIKFKQFNINMFKHSKKSQNQLYYVMLSIAAKWSDLVIIFSNVYNTKVKHIINICKQNNKDYIIVKE